MSSGVPPGFQAHLEAVDALEAATGVLAGLGGSLFACPSPELGPVLGLLSRVVALGEAARVLVVREAAKRGVIASSDAASPTDWIVSHTLPGDPDNPPVPGSAPIPVADAAALARVAYTCQRQAWAALDQALLAGRVSPRVADRIVKEHTRLKDALPHAMHADVLAGFITLAEAGARPVELGRFRDRLTAQYANEGVLQARHDKLAAHRGLSGFAADPDGMYHATLILDPEAHAIIAPVIDTLSAPAPTTDEHGHPVPDERCADQRRADALVEVCTAYQAAGKAVRRGVSTRLVVTMTLDQLQAATGCALTATGDALPPRDRAPPGLRRRDHPGRPRQRRTTPGRRTRTTPGHPRPVDRPGPTGQRMQLPRLPLPARVDSSPPHHPLAGPRPHRPGQPHPLMPTTPHHRPQTRIHRHRHQDRRHLAHRQNASSEVTKSFSVAVPCIVAIPVRAPPGQATTNLR